MYGVSDCIETIPNEVYGISTNNAGIHGITPRQPVLCQTNDGQSGSHAYEDVNNLNN